MADKDKVLVICGPTASGKTGLSVLAAQRLNGEIICADSMQIYQHLSVGTAKISKEEMQGIPHHLVDFLQPNTPFSVAEYVTMAKACIADITSRGKLPIVVGGTGLYIQSLVNGIAFTDELADKTLRNELEKRLAQDGIHDLYQTLCEVDPEAAKAIHPNNQGRVLRALEIYYKTGLTKTQAMQQSIPAERPYRDVCIALQYATREEHYQKINVRVDTMMAQGLLQEAEYVYQNRDAFLTAAQAIGYKEFFPYFAGEQTIEPCVDALKQATRHYAKRQLTWFRRMEPMHWLRANTEEVVDEIIALMQ